MSCKVIGIVVGGIIAAVIIAIIAVVANCFMKLETSEVAVTYNSYTKTLHSEVLYEGLHMGAPTLNFIKFPSVFQTLDYKDKSCLNEDGVTVSLSVSMQYKIRPSNIRDIVMQFKDQNGYVNMITKIGSTAVHDVCSVFNTTQLQAERGRFQEELARALVGKFDVIHTDVTDVQVNNIARPWQYENAIKAKESAREDIQVARNERPRLLTEAETLKRQALSEADIILNQANSDVKIKMNKAQAQAKGILNEYTKEAASYKKLKTDNGLDNVGFLAYMGIRAISNAKNDVHVSMKGPAQTSFSG